MMKSNFGFKEENKMKTIKAVIEKLILRVHADETVTDGTTITTTEPKGTGYTVNFEDLVSKARKEEKDKLYPQISSLKEEVSNLTEKSNKHLLALEGKDKEIQEVKKQLEEAKSNVGKSDNEKITSLTKEIEKLGKELEKAKSAKINLEEIENKIKSEYEVKLHREVKLREAGEEIIPELVSGTTKEEIDASIEISKKRYKEIVGKSVLPKGVKDVPPANTNTSRFNQKEFSAEDIMRMDPKSDEYKEFRKKIGFK